MAIVEDISESESPSQSSSFRRRRPNTDKDFDANSIPLSHPSSARLSRPDTTPLVSLTPPDSASASDGNEDQDEDENDEYEEEGGGASSHRLSAEEAGVREDEIFTTLIYSVPFTFLYLLLDILVHLQYSHRPTLNLLAKHVATALPTLSMIVLYSNRYPNYTLTNSILMATSIVSGTRLIYLVNKASWSVVTAQAPAMGTLWIVSIVQLPLSRALLSLFFVAGWCWWSGLQYMPK